MGTLMHDLVDYRRHRARHRDLDPESSQAAESGVTLGMGRTFPADASRP